MPISHQINEDLNVVISNLEGKITDSELLHSYKNLYENPSWKPGFSEIVDMRKADMSNVSPTGLKKLSDLVTSYTINAKIQFKTAIIAPDDLPFGLGRLYEAYSDESPESTSVFREIDKAFEWLGLDLHE